MDASNGIWGAVIAFIGLIGMLATARRGPRELPPNQGTSDGSDPGAGKQAGQLQVSPAIWQDMRGEIRELKTRVDHLTEVVEQGGTRERTLREHMRLAMKVIRRANRRLHQAGQPEEPVPTELIQYSLD